MVTIKLHKRKAISAVLTTIIILVASIVLGTGVVVFSTGLFQSGGQQQAVQVIGLKTWINGTWSGVQPPASTCPSQNCGPTSTTIAYGAFAIKNTGDKILSVSSINVRGASIPFVNWYADIDQVRVGQNFQAQLNYTKNDIFGNIKGSANTGAYVAPALGANPTACVQSLVGTNPPTMIVIQEVPQTPSSNSISPVCLALQSGPIALNPGASAIVYYKMPNNLLTPTDSGVTSTTSILAGTAPIAQTIRIANP